ncbi:MAG: acyl-CoA thioesterase [Bacteroidia bacterium]|nr:acyl-CoA thioesterase [Bacteroidia bacterium]MDW8302333.1 thioesterase family protein [Bacteroidia bacterium]
MIEHTTELRVRYAETDQMGIVYYGNYAQYFEVARVELLRHIGITYAFIEQNGIFMPVLNLECQFHAPAYYDEILKAQASIPTLPTTRIRIMYKIFNLQDKLLTSGSTELAFVSRKTQKPIRCPDFILEKMKPYF